MLIYNVNFAQQSRCSAPVAIITVTLVPSPFTMNFSQTCCYSKSQTDDRNPRTCFEEECTFWYEVLPTCYQSWVVIAFGAFHYINCKALLSLSCPVYFWGESVNLYRSHRSRDFNCCTKWRAWKRAAETRETNN